MEEKALDPRLHFVVATAIIAKGDKFLIMKRAAHEKAYPSKWTVPGGKLVLSEYKDIQKTTHDAWYNIIEWLIKKEVREEAGIEITKPRYFTDLVFVRPDGYPVVTLSYWALWESGEVEVGKDLVDHAWVTVDEAKRFDLIEGIWEEIRDVDRLIRSGQ